MRTATVELDTVAMRWELALDAADHALSAAHGLLPDAELHRWRQVLARERPQAAAMLVELARVARIHPKPWLSPVPVSHTMIGLLPRVRACLFDLDGVLTDSGVLHARAWAEAFDWLLLELAQESGRHFIPFDRTGDYGAYVDGRPRIDGVHGFLASRGIRLAAGRPDDTAGARTAYGLARRKGEALTRELDVRGVSPMRDARRYLAASGYAGLGRAVISASTRTSPMLELAGLQALVEESIDADAMRAKGLRARPAPDLLLAACESLAVRPEETVTFTHSPAGVAAGHAAGMTVIGVAEGEDGEILRGYGAERVVPSLGSLLDRRLTG